jgi:hypothetical protein
LNDTNWDGAELVLNVIKDGENKLIVYDYDDSSNILSESYSRVLCQGYQHSTICKISRLDDFILIIHEIDNSKYRCILLNYQEEQERDFFIEAPSSNIGEFVVDENLKHLFFIDGKKLYTWNISEIYRLLQDTIEIDTNI